MTDILLCILICIHVLFLLYHIVIILKLIPYKMIWGGRLKSDEQMYRFETVSIVLTVIFTVILLAKGNYLGVSLPQQVVAISLWVMAILYLINTVGNLKSKSRTEKIIFAPLTIVMFISLLIILLTP